MSVRYRFSAEKSLAAIHWMVSQRHEVDLHTGLKGIYFSDKSFLNEHYRPIFGARYRAMKYGPVPLEPYEMMKGEAIFLSELNIEQYPWELNGYKLRILGNSEPDLGEFSSAEREHLEEGFRKSSSLTFTARTAATHGFDWQNANGGMMRYEDMLEKANRRADVLEYMRDTCRTVRL